MAQKTIRDKWRKAKADAAKSFDLSKLVDKEKFGPKLDKYEATREAYDKAMKKLGMSPNPAKEAAAKKALVDAAKAAFLAGAKYLTALQFLAKSCTGATKAAADDLVTELTMEILPPLSKAAKGDLTELD